MDNIFSLSNFSILRRISSLSETHLQWNWLLAKFDEVPYISIGDGLRLVWSNYWYQSIGWRYSPVRKIGKMWKGIKNYQIVLLSELHSIYINFYYFSISTRRCNGKYYVRFPRLSWVHLIDISHHIWQKVNIITTTLLDAK